MLNISLLCLIWLDMVTVDVDYWQHCLQKQKSRICHKVQDCFRAVLNFKTDFFETRRDLDDENTPLITLLLYRKLKEF